MIKVNTSNKFKVSFILISNKFSEFERMFKLFNVEIDCTNYDLKEIISDPISVVVHKATQAGKSTFYYNWKKMF